MSIFELIFSCVIIICVTIIACMGMKSSNNTSCNTRSSYTPYNFPEWTYSRKTTYKPKK